MKLRGYRIFALAVALLLCLPSRAQEPLYVVNGERMTAEEFHRIDPELIERIESLPADEQSISIYGPKASNGVILVTLHSDTPARFPEGEFEAWVTQRVAWDEDEHPARIALRFEISPEGIPQKPEVLEATDKRLLRRVLKALEESPRWQPALKMGKAVASTQLLHLTLPEGHRMAPERYIILR